MRGNRDISNTKHRMDKQKLKEFVEKQLEGSDYYLVDLTVSPANEIKVEIDSDGYADIDRCVELTREIEEAFPRDDEDYELEVGTSGLTSPLKVFRQYQKYIGKDMLIQTADGRKLRGTLLKADPEEGIVLSVLEKVKPEGAKRPVIQEREIPLTFPEIAKAQYDLQF